MRIAYITAGAAGMFCGSCLKDNTLVSALRQAGQQAVLIPTYTPIRTDEEDVSLPRVFLGGINVYLEQKFALFRRTPRWLDHLFNRRWLLRLVSRLASQTPYRELGELTVSLLRGMEGNQAKEIAELAQWLAEEWRPDVVILTNALLSGIIPEIRRRVGVPVVVTLQGDDIFLDALSAEHREQCRTLIRANCTEVAAFIATSRYYADYMAAYLDIPRSRIEVIYPGIHRTGCRGACPARRDPPLTIGYFARICPEKGWHQLVEAYVLLRQKGQNLPPLRLKVGGYLGVADRPYFQQQMQRLERAGLKGEVEHLDCPTHADKLRFLQSLDVLSVPTVYREPKGLYLLEAWANGVPVVQPAHGAFPELLEQTGGGVLVPPGQPLALAQALEELILDPERRERLGQAGAAAVAERFTAERMAEETVQLLERCRDLATLPS
jgi:glycosyltransferase involved in cell wall biosynthesis